MPKILAHQKYSSVTLNLIRDVTKESDQSDSQCYAMACLGALWLCRGEEGRKKIHKYCNILQELHDLSEEYQSLNYLQLIDNIISNKLPPEHIKPIKEIDNNFELLKILPISAVIHFLYFSPELKPEFPEILAMPKFTDQDFVKSEYLFNEISKDENLIPKLQKVFPQYQTIAGQLFKDEYKLIESQWKCENGNSISEVSNMYMTKNGLKKFCGWIKDTIEAEPDDIKYKNVQLVLSIKHHAISLQYDVSTKKWYIIDSLNLEDENIIDGLDDNNMLDRLYQYINYEKNDDVQFSYVLLLDKKLNINNFIFDAFVEKHDVLILKLKEGSKTFIITDTSDYIDFLDYHPKYKFEMMSNFLNKNNIIIKSKEDAINLFDLQFKTCVDNLQLLDGLLKTVNSYELNDNDRLTLFSKALFHIHDKNSIAYIMKSLSIKIDMKNNNNETLLIVAINERNDKAIEYLINHYPEVNLNDCDKNGWNALHLAAYCGNTLLVQTLLNKNKSMLDGTNNNKSTALHIAVMNNDQGLVKILLAAGANPDIKNANGETPLVIAITQRYEKIIKYLINTTYAINLNACDKDGWNALHIASYCGDKFLVQTLINKNKSMLDVPNNNKSTALHYAVQNDHPDIVNILLESGADPNIKNSDDDTPLIVAIRNKNNKAIDYFVNHSATNLIACDKNGWNALHISALKGNKLLVNRLIEKNKSMIDEQKNDKWTALHLAVKNNYFDIVKILLDAGANTNIKNANNETPEQIAKDNNYADILKLFAMNKKNNLNPTSHHTNTKLDTASIKRKNITLFEDHPPSETQDKEIPDMVNKLNK